MIGRVLEDTINNDMQRRNPDVDGSVVPSCTDYCIPRNMMQKCERPVKAYIHSVVGRGRENMENGHWSAHWNRFRGAWYRIAQMQPTIDDLLCICSVVAGLMIAPFLSAKEVAQWLSDFAMGCAFIMMVVMTGEVATDNFPAEKGVRLLLQYCKQLALLTVLPLAISYGIARLVFPHLQELLWLVPE